MNDFMTWFYDHYIHARIEAQPMDDGDQMRFSMLETSHTAAQREDLEIALRYYACHGFLLGLRTGTGLTAGAGI